VLAKEGLHPPINDLWGIGGTHYLDGLNLPEAYAIRMQSLRHLVGVYSGEVEKLEREVHGLLADHAGYQAIQALDGVGRILGAIFVAEIGDVTRFPNPQTLSSWAGLTPKHRESDVKVHRGGVTKRGSPLVRWAAIEAISHIRRRTQAQDGLPPHRGTSWQEHRPRGGGPQVAHPRLLRPARRQIRCLAKVDEAA